MMWSAVLVFAALGSGLRGGPPVGGAPSGEPAEYGVAHARRLDAGSSGGQAGNNATDKQSRTTNTGNLAEAYALFLRARDTENDGDADEALKLYQQAAKLDPSSGDIPAAIAGLYARQNRLREALAAAEIALKIDPGTVEAHWVLGTIYAAYSQSEESAKTATARQAERDFAERAIPHLEAVLNARGATADPELLLTLGRLYLKTSDANKAVGLLSRFIEIEPDSLDAVVLLSEAYTKAGRIDDAIKLLTSGAEREPALYPPLATALEQAGRWKDAVDAYAKASQQGVNSVDLRRRWAIALMNADRPGDAAKARDLLQQVLDKDPKDTRAMYLLVQAQRQLNDYQAAEATARRLIAADPGGLSGPYALAQVFEQRHQPRSVIDTLQPVVDRLAASAAADTGSEAPLLLHLAFAYIDLDQPDRAISILERAKQRAPNDSTIDVGLAQAHIAAKRYAQAADLADKARVAHPDDVRLARLEADALRQSGQMDRGVAILEQIRQAHPDDPANYVALAQLLVSGDRAEQAASVMQTARTRFPEDLSVLFETGAVCERQKKYAEAEKLFKDVLAENPLHAPALNYLGYMLADRGLRLGESVKYIRRALEVEPDNPAYLDSLGWAYFKMNRLDLAEPNLRRAAADRPTDSAVQDHLGDLLLKLGRPDEAIAAWKRALAGDGEDIDRPAIDGKIRSASEKARK